jgi:hypothetical protein
MPSLGGELAKPQAGMNFAILPKKLQILSNG